MQALILGSAAGGGFPQWNCRCRLCRSARAGVSWAKARTQSAVAVKGTGSRWLLLNASPDVRSQLERLPPADLGEADAPARYEPFGAVALTDAQLDHATGLLLLREGTSPLCVY